MADAGVLHLFFLVHDSVFLAPEVSCCQPSGGLCLLPVLLTPFHPPCSARGRLKCPRVQLRSASPPDKGSVHKPTQTLRNRQRGRAPKPTIQPPPCCVTFSSVCALSVSVSLFVMGRGWLWLLHCGLGHIKCVAHTDVFGTAPGTWEAPFPVSQQQPPGGASGECREILEGGH